jgi:SlyX protein
MFDHFITYGIPLCAFGFAQESRTMNEDRLVDIEIKLTRSDDMLEVLSQTVYEQQKKIDRLEALYAALLRRLPESADNGADRNFDNERPPHY